MILKTVKSTPAVYKAGGCGLINTKRHGMHEDASAVTASPLVVSLCDQADNTAQCRRFNQFWRAFDHHGTGGVSAT